MVNKVWSPDPLLIIWILLPSSRSYYASTNTKAIVLTGIEEGSRRRLCCNVKIAQPLLNTSLELEWYYYKQLDTYGSSGYTVVQVCLD